MKRLATTAFLAACLTSCGALALQTDPETGQERIVSTATGEPVDVAGTTGTVVGTLTGNPAIGLGAGAVASALLAAALRKRG